jgi:hypothetical protein
MNEPTDQDLGALALEAFLYAFPLYEMARMRAATSPRKVAPQGLAGEGPDNPQRWCNHFVQMRKLLGAGGSRVVTPNNDTLYSNAWLDLAASPLVIDVPDSAGRYYVLGLLDFYTNPFAHIGARLTGTGAGSFLITGPDWQGEVPPPFAQSGRHVRSPTRWVWLIGRWLVDGEHDLPAVHALQDGLVMRPLAAWLAGAPEQPERFDPQWDAKLPLAAAQFAAQVNRALRENPPPAHEAALVARFSAIGIGPDGPEQPSAAHSLLLDQAIHTGMAQLQASTLGGTQHLGWTLPARLDGGFGDDFPRRAAVALKYIGALESREAIYPMAYDDADGQPLSGEHAYRLHFAADELPPVDGFWSLTMYSRRDFLLVPNPIGRFAIGDRTPGLRYGADGSLTLSIQHAMPEGDAARDNWLPAPPDGFYVCLRAYLPRDEMLTGQHQLPGLQRVAQRQVEQAAR